MKLGIFGKYFTKMAGIFNFKSRARMIETEMVLHILFVIGITVESMSGALAAGKLKMDLVGVIFISLVTAIGGGSIRDVLFDNHPVSWVKYPEYIWILVVASLVATRIPAFMQRFEKVFLILDAVGLVVFSIIGTQAIMQLYDDMTLAVCGGVITGVFGGILRDIFCNKIPLIFQKEVYASVAIASSALYYVLVQFCGANEGLASFITLVFGTAFRLLGIYYKLSIPVFYFKEK